MAERTQTIEIHNVFFKYTIGNTFTMIWTAESQWANLPDYLKIQLSIETPDGDRVGAIVTTIGEKVAEQKQTGKFAAVKITPRTSAKAKKMAESDQLFLAWEAVKEKVS